MLIKGIEIKVVKGDITDLKVEAIVNAANNELVMGGGVAGAIKRKGGKIIEDEAIKLAPIKTGESVVTSAGKLAAKYVIHAATMGIPACRQAGILLTDEVKIRQATSSALELAEKKGVKSIAFCALGCGTGGFDYAACAKVMSQEVFRLIHEKKNKNIKEIIFVLRDEQAKDIFENTVFSYLGYISKKLEEGPFITVDAIIMTAAGVVIIQRSNPPFGWALPGGFVDYGESVEEAVAREAKEETSLDIYDLRQFHTYSDPGRDPRFHTVTTVFTAKAEGMPCAASDARDIRAIKEEELDKIHFAFDHKEILKEYFNKAKLRG